MDQRLSGSQNGVEFGPFKLLVSERRLERKGVPVKLGSRALEILTMLVQKSGQIVDKREILDRVWPGLIVEENTLRVHIRDLRKTLEDGVGDNRYIVNVPGRGYGFVVRQADSSVAEASSQFHLAPSERLPSRPQGVIGRDGAIDAVMALVVDKRFVTLHGPGGIGKTTIATVAAHELDRHFAGATFFVDLGALTDAEFVPMVLASTLGLPLPSEDPATTLIRTMRDRRMLLILDSCEHVIGAVADLAERIFRWAPDVSLLATSREPLWVAGEHVFSVASLDLPAHADEELSTDAILASPAASFFIQRARASGSWFELNATNVELVAQICRKLDGNPLAMELAAMRAGMHGLRETVDLLDGGLRLEWKGRRTASRRHQTLNAMLDWSHDLLSEDEQRVLRRLSIFVGAFALEDARILSADDQISDSQVADILDQLVAKSLVSFYAEEQGARYRLLDTTRAYARAKLVEAGEEEWTSCRHAAHCLVFLRRTCAGSSGVMRAEHRNARASNLGNIRAALQWCFGQDGDRQLGVELAAVATSLFIELSLISECRRWAEQALKCMDVLDRGDRLELDLQDALGHALMFTVGNEDQVQTALDRGLQIARDNSDPFAQFRLLSRLHMFYRRSGQFEHLLPICEQLWEIASLLQDPVPLAAAHGLFGVSLHLLGDQDGARTHLEDPVHQIAAVRQVAPGHFAFHRNPQITIARALWLKGHPDLAVQTARGLVGQLAPDRDAVTFGIGLIWATAVHKWVGDWETVEENAGRLIDHAERYGLKPYLSVGVALRGEVMTASGDLNGGTDLLRDSVRNLRMYRYELYTPESSCALALALAAIGQTDQAVPIIDDEIARIQRHGTSYCMPELLRVRGDVLAAAADETGAARQFEQAIALADNQATLSWRLRAVTSLARLRLKQGRGGETIQLLKDTYERFEEGFGTVDLKSAKALIDAC
ncbi:ATPase [Paraburkholderia sp. JPY432]|uniref:ATP-binding protein n=1 Tax=Paraburkholderia youngii TaxID=2782701 RepID=UPI00159574DC|nr:winged helix-turn-helix domain-containing protein [Paraburkholderia youngii]NVH75771.1 ATPase [Paraburkholderia youngii]